MAVDMDIAHLVVKMDTSEVKKGLADMDNTFAATLTSLGTMGGTMWKEIFETGTFQADRFFAHMASQMAQMAATNITKNLFGALVGGLSGLGGLTGFATGGIALPVGLPASGGLLTGPTFFHDAGGSKAYARGGLSVAGEAGLEAFMPARRMSDGNMGVRVQYPSLPPTPRIGSDMDDLRMAITTLAERLPTGTDTRSGTRIVNVLDSSLINEALASPTGEQTILNVIKSNAPGIKQLLQ